MTNAAIVGLVVSIGLVLGLRWFIAWTERDVDRAMAHKPEPVDPKLETRVREIRDNGSEMSEREITDRDVEDFESRYHAAMKKIRRVPPS